MKNEFLKDLTVRVATSKDSSAIVALIFNIWIKEYSFEVKEKDFPDLLNIEDSYLKKAGLFLVAVINGRIIGTIAADKLDDKAYVLKRMFVDKCYRGQGIAQMLLEALFDKIVYSEKQRFVKFYLSTKEAEAIAAKRFYLKNGFQVITKSQLPKDFPFFYEDDLFMLKNKW